MKTSPLDTKEQNSFSPIKTKRVFEEVSAEIKKSIVRGAFKPGDRLPSEVELSRQFGVSRQTIREALRILELSGFITIQRGAVGGAIIVDTILKSVSESLVDAIQMRKISPDDLNTCRLEVEKAMMRYVISYADASDIQRLQDNIDEAKGAADKGIPPFKQNLQFHRILARASGNHMFFVIVDSMMAVISDFFTRIPPDFEISKEVITVHEEILGAIKEKNLDKAIVLLEKHIPEIGHRFRGMADSA
ncbi:MAG: FCD domain-containing protein [Pseudomonadota bacterium]